jgi:hypothetical protein
MIDRQIHEFEENTADAKVTSRQRNCSSEWIFGVGEELEAVQEVDITDYHQFCSTGRNMGFLKMLQKQLQYLVRYLNFPMRSIMKLGFF